MLATPPLSEVLPQSLLTSPHASWTWFSVLRCLVLLPMMTFNAASLSNGSRRRIESMRSEAIMIMRPHGSGSSLVRAEATFHLEITSSIETTGTRHGAHTHALPWPCAPTRCKLNSRADRMLSFFVFAGQWLYVNPTPSLLPLWWRHSGSTRAQPSRTLLHAG